jgi:cytochrome b6-f complex iron-sulfur subunit
MTAPISPAPVWRVEAGHAAPSTLVVSPEQREMVHRRRQFLRGSFWAGMGVLLVGGLASAAEFFTPAVKQRFTNSIFVPAAKVPKPGGEPYHDLDGKFWLVNLKPGEGSPAEFRQFGEPSHAGGLLALYHRCTHLGCTVPWRPDFQFGGVTGWFNCPCHAAVYTKGGIHVFGSAARSMDTFPITAVTRRGVSVDTGRVLLGANDDPQRTVPAGPFK